MERKRLILTVMGAAFGFLWTSAAHSQSTRMGQKPPFEMLEGTTGESRRGAFPTEPGPEANPKSSDLEQRNRPEPRDTEVIAVLYSEKLSRGKVRQLSAWFRQSDPSLSQEEALDRAAFVAAFELTMYAEATKRGIIVPFDQAIRVRDQQKQLCKQHQECAQTTAAIAAGLGISEAEYWSVERCQRALTIEQMTHKALAEKGLTKEEQTIENLQEWQKQVLKEAPIQWFDSNLEQKFPDIIVKMKPVIAGGKGIESP